MQQQKKIVTAGDRVYLKFFDLEFFHQFVRSMFCHRRKFLRAELLAATKNRLDKPEIDRIMAAMAFGPTTRAEELDVPTMLALTETVRRQLA